MNRSVTERGVRLDYQLYRQARHDVLLKALPEGIIRVYAPSYMSLRDIDNVVRAHAKDLAAMCQSVDEAWREKRSAFHMRQGRQIFLEGKAYSLLPESGAMKVEFQGDVVRVCTPDPSKEEDIRDALRAHMSRLALKRIRERLEIYIPRIGKQPGRVTIREQKTRWGSCSERGNLNFNWKLIMAPPEALDYVVIHELAHLWEFNHSPAFWERVRREMPEYESWKKWLKAHGPELTL